MTSSYPTRRVPRLRDYDYSQAGAYFVTLCAENRRCLFGTMADGDVHLNPLGAMIASSWEGLGNQFPIVEIDAFIVMPNHMHAVLLLNEQPSSTGDRLDLSEILRRFKTFTAYEFRERLQKEYVAYGKPKLWQRGYFDRVIRNDRELNAIREYILNNPMQWHLDRENPDILARTDGRGRPGRDVGNG